jgi:hypothetical protein
MNYPTIGEYNQFIHKRGGDSFKTLNGINLIPSRTTPIKVYLFGSGAFAAVFKGLLNGNTYAIRCFLSAENETIERYQNICKYLSNLNSSWKTECEFLDNEISVNGITYPILKMEWINGILINEFVTQNLSNNNVLSELQIKLISVSRDLEKNKIGHGDLQCGNIVVSGNSLNFQIKLIDYDGMYVPDLAFKKSIEKGRSEFQHPKRTFDNFSPEMDRFSFWVIITALEALKVDKSLWREVMQGGFNTLDNFLFTIQDFINPNQSLLFNRLHQLNSPALTFYLETLKFISFGEINRIPKPEIYKQIASGNTISNDYQKHVSNSNINSHANRSFTSNKYKIITENGSASVLTSTFQRLGSTPLELDKKTYEGKVILISNGKDTKRITLNSHQNLIEIKFK